jgi:hypothetical protein
MTSTPLPPDVGHRSGFWPWVLRLLLVAGLATLVVVYRAPILAALRSVSRLDPSALLALPLFWLWNHAAATGWRGLIGVADDEPRPSSLRLTIVRIEAQALNLVLPLASIGGDVLRSTLIARRRGGLATSASAVVLDSTAAAVAGLLFAAVGVGLRWDVLPLSRGWQIAALAVGLVLAAALGRLPLLLGRLAGWRRIDPGSRTARALQAFVLPRARLTPAFRAAVAWHLVERTLGALEVLVLAHALGLPLGLRDAVFASAVMTGFTLFLFFIPAQAGAAEGGFALAFEFV